MDYEPGLKPFWKPDYKKDVTQVFAEATMFICLMMDDLRFLNLVEPMMENSDDSGAFGSTASVPATYLTLALAGKYSMLRTEAEQQTNRDDAKLLTAIDGFRRTPMQGLPSWVPNWAQKGICSTVPGDYEMPGDTEQGVHPYRASGALKPKVKFTQTSGGAIFELETKGVEFGTVLITGKDFYGRSDDSMLADAATIVESLKSIVIPVGQSFQEAVMRTLAGNRCPDGTNIRKPDYELLKRCRSRFGRGRKFFVLDSNTIGIGPRATRPGDTVFIIPGCHVPVVMRAREVYTKSVICPEHNDTDVHGIMDGECENLILEKPELSEVLHLR
ncbi:hypothetical protein LTR67_002926 [Exophiala xenobiotica]